MAKKNQGMLEFSVVAVGIVCRSAVVKAELEVKLSALFVLHSLILLANGTLLITQVKPRNTGTYRCVGHGISGSQVTLEASLLIAGKQPELCSCH